jgi:lipopolysaccharide biosynthesis glycosyltransferase
MKIIFAADPAFLHGLQVAMASLSKSWKRNPLPSVAVLHESLTSIHRIKISYTWNRGHEIHSPVDFIDIRMFDLHGVRLIRGSKMAYARMLIPELFPEECEAIYCDSDILLTKGLEDFLTGTVEEFDLVAVQDAAVGTIKNDCQWKELPLSHENDPYFNSGLMRINLNAWREHQITTRSLEIAKREPEKCRYWDQSILNYLCVGRVRFIEKVNNLQIREDDKSIVHEDANIHFVGNRKPWLLYSDNPDFRRWRRAYAENVSRIPFYALRPSYWLITAAVGIGRITASRDLIRKLRRKLLGW